MTGRAAHEQLPVLDIEQGVARLMGNQAVYFNALKRFTVHVDTPRAIATHLAAGDRATASRVVHTLKGAAGLLCAAEVHAIAAQLEAALEGGHAEQALIDDLDAAMQRVRGRIDAALPKAAGSPVTFVPPPPIGNVQELFDRLQALLDEGNATAIDMLDQYEAVLEKALGSAAWGTVAAAARDYDFERALDALRSAR